MLLTMLRTMLCRCLYRFYRIYRLRSAKESHIGTQRAEDGAEWEPWCLEGGEALAAAFSNYGRVSLLHSKPPTPHRGSATLEPQCAEEGEGQRRGDGSWCLEGGITAAVAAAFSTY